MKRRNLILPLVVLALLGLAALGLTANAAPPPSPPGQVQLDPSVSDEGPASDAPGQVAKNGDLPPDPGTPENAATQTDEVTVHVIRNGRVYGVKVNPHFSSAVDDKGNTIMTGNIDADEVNSKLPPQAACPTLPPQAKNDKPPPC